MPNSSYFWSKSIYFFWYTDRLNGVVFIARQWIDLRHTVVGWLQIIIHPFTFGRLLSTHRPTRPSSSLWFRLMWFLALVFFFLFQIKSNFIDSSKLSCCFERKNTSSRFSKSVLRTTSGIRDGWKNESEEKKKIRIMTEWVKSIDEMNKTSCVGVKEKPIFIFIKCSCLEFSAQQITSILLLFFSGLCVSCVYHLFMGKRERSVLGIIFLSFNFLKHTKKKTELLMCWYSKMFEIPNSIWWICLEFACRNKHSMISKQTLTYLLCSSEK